MDELITMLTNNGLGVVCVAYLIYFQCTTMKEMLSTLNAISNRLTAIEVEIRKANNDVQEK